MEPPRRDETDSLVRLRQALASAPPSGVVSVYAFGSVPEGRPHRESDLDIGVLFDWAAYPTARARFEAELDLRVTLSPAVVGRELDLVVLNDAPPLLGRHIVRGTRVFLADAEADHAFQRDVQLRAADLEPFIRRMRADLRASLHR